MVTDTNVRVRGDLHHLLTHPVDVASLAHMVFDEDSRKSLSEDVRSHVLSEDVVDLELFLAVKLADPVMIAADLLHVTMLLGLVDNSNGRLVVHVHDEQEALSGLK